MSIRIPIFLINLIVLTVVSALAITYHVKPDGTGDFPTIQDAVTASVDGDTILLENGIFTGDGNRYISYEGKAVTVKSAEGMPEFCVINCQGVGYGFAFSSDEGSGSVLDGVTVTNGSYSNGGGIHCYHSSPTIKNCILTDCTSGAGGGIYCTSSSPTIDSCTISNNYGGQGGGILIRNASSPLIVNCIIKSNTSSDEGGGINCRPSATPVIRGCTITGNSAVAGGGVSCIDWSDARIESCVITANTARDGAGLYIGHESDAIVADCRITGNRSALTGGGIYVNDANPTLSGCSISGNWANAGGGICCAHFCSPTAEYCVLWDNCATWGDEACFDDVYQSAITFLCSDVDSSGFYGPGDVTWLYGNFSSDPLFCEPVLCTEAPTIEGDFTLMAGSPCLPENNPCGVQIGALGMGCGDVPFVTVCPDGSGDYLTIQDAINEAAEGDTIELCDGTFTGPGNKDLDYLGKAITVRSQSGNPDSCVIDCESSGRGFYFHSGEGPGSVLQGVTITNGYFPPTNPVVSGGGLYCDSESSPTLIDVVFTGNTAGRGGGLHCRGGSPTLRNCLFTNNASHNSAGGMYCVGSSPTLIECEFSGNSATSNGGGMSCYESSFPLFDNCVFVGNSSPNGGGGLSVHYSMVTLYDCVFTGNTALYGGGLVCQADASASLTNCMFEGNSADDYGGGMGTHSSESGNSSYSLSHCTFSGNHSGSHSGALDCRGHGLHMLTNCTLSNNSVGGYGGGMTCRNGANTSMDLCTFYGNEAVQGSAIYCDEYSSSASAENTIIAFGIDGDAVHCVEGSVVALSCCDVYGNAGGDWVGCIADQEGMSGNISADPLFCDAGSGDFRLSSGSPCLEGDCGQIGAYGLGCHGGPPWIINIQDVGNDQGRQVRIRWHRSLHDAPGEPTITGYGLYRRQDQYLLCKQPGITPRSVDGLAKPRLDGWDYIMTVPAHGDSIYQCVAPTLCDSTAGDGICWSVFLIRGMTPDPLVFYDSAPDSGYSVDNVAPDIPEDVVWDYPAGIAWDESDEPDFSYFTIYGSSSDDFDRDAVILGHTVEASYDLGDSQDIYEYYFITATDIAGNEGAHAVLQTPADVKAIENLPRAYALRRAMPNPFTGWTVLSFDLPEACETEFTICDVGGRLVRTLLNSDISAGRHKAIWDGLGDNGESVPPGVYFARFQAGAFRTTERIVLLR